MNKWLLAFLSVGTWSGFVPPAIAQSCNFSVTALNFGPIDILSKAAATSTATISVNCTGTARRNLVICPNIGDGSGGSIAGGARRTMASGSNRLQFQLYSDANRSSIWGSHVWANSQRPPSYVLALGSTGSASMTATIHGLVFANQSTISPGSFTSSFAGHTVFGYQYETTSSNCGATYPNQSGVPFTASAQVPANCLIETQGVDFGSSGILAGNVDADGQIDVTCTKDTDYGIALDNGQNGSGPIDRHMAKGPERIRYGLYRDVSRSQPWGSGANIISGKGNGTSQSYQVHGRVPVQVTPSAGNYSDIVLVTVTY